MVVIQDIVEPEGGWSYRLSVWTLNVSETHGVVRQFWSPPRSGHHCDLGPRALNLNVRAHFCSNCHAKCWSVLAWVAFVME